MDTKVTAKYIHMSPRKVRLVVDLVRGLDIAKAQHQLTFSNKDAAKPVLKALNSAIANAQNNANADTTGYIVTEARVDEAPTFKRYRPRAHGRAAAIRKRMSHITVAIGPKAGEKKAEEKVPAMQPAVKKAPAKTEEKAVKTKANAKKTAAKKTDSNVK